MSTRLRTESTAVIADNAEVAIQRGREKIGAEGAYSILIEYKIGEVTAYLVACKPTSRDRDWSKVAQPLTVQEIELDYFMRCIHAGDNPEFALKRMQQTLEALERVK